MYICHDCGKEFEVPVRDQWYDEYHRKNYEFNYCPNCGSDDINEVYPEDV
jgi:DNA-directed RNA polymerase subunit RPC12/RpoP